MTIAVDDVDENSALDIVFDSDTAAEQDVNTEGANDQVDPAIAAFDDGGYIVVWSSAGQDSDSVSRFGVYGQRFNADGTANGAEFLVTSETGDTESDAAVTTFSDGGFVVTWQDQITGVRAFIEARVFNSDGTPATADFAVSPVIANSSYEPTVQALNDSEFVVLWSNEGGGANQIAGQIYDRTGATVDAQFAMGSFGGGVGLYGANTEVTLLDDGGFAAVWKTNDGSSTGTRFAVRNADGSLRTAETTIAGGDNFADISSLSNGGFVVTYDSGGDLRAAVYDANGSVDVAEFTVNSTSSASSFQSTVTRSDDGFVVVWQSDSGDGDGSAILAQRFDSSGNKIDGEVVVNETTAGNQNLPEVVVTASGQVIAVWQSDNVDAAGTGIVSRVIGTGDAGVNENAANGTRVADVIGVLDLDSDDTHTFVLTDNAGGRFAINATTGEITVADRSLLDFEANTTHTITVQATDAGSNTYSESLTITVEDGIVPTQSVPGAQSVDEDNVLTFSSGNSNAVTVSDTLADTNTELQVTLSVNDGVLHLNAAALSNVDFVTGSNGSGSFVINGTEFELNAAFEGMTFTPTADFNGSVTLDMTTAIAADLAGNYTLETDASDQSEGTSYDGTLNGDAAIVDDNGVGGRG
ncbi:MAG: cadherin repeat domain-containing protein, partial [Rubripirellula sp.]